MEEEIRILVNKRGILKGRVTKFRNYFDRLDKQRLTNANIKILLERLSRIEPIWDEYTVIQTELELKKELDEDEKIEVEEFEDSFFELVGDVKSVIEEYEQNLEQNRQRSDTSEASGVGSVTGSLINNNNMLRLPPIEIPRFDGDYSSWQEFRDAFCGLVDNNPSLTNYQKFYYLR